MQNLLYDVFDVCSEVCLQGVPMHMQLGWCLRTAMLAGVLQSFLAADK